jgi:hypothetical protein
MASAIGIDLALASEQKSPPRAGDDVGEQPDVGRGEALRLGRLPHREEVALPHVGEDQVLLVRDAQLAEAVALGQVGDEFHLPGGQRRPAARRSS